MPDTYLNRVKMTVSPAPGTGTATLNAASTGYVAFASGDGGKTYSILWEDTGNAWEIGTGCTYTHSGTSLTRGTRIASSTGSALNLTSAATATVIIEAGAASRWDGAALADQVTVSGTSGAITAAVDTMYIADMSGWTADRTLTLPATAAVGDRVGMMVTTGDDAYEWLITAASGDTLNGVSGGTEWSRLFMTGEVVIMRCVVANTTWIVETDGRKFEKCRIDTDGTTASHTRNTSTKISSELATETSDVDAIWDASNKRLIPRRKGAYVIHGHLQMANMADGNTCVAQIYKNGTTNIGGGGSASTSAAAAYPEADVVLFYENATVGDYYELFVYYSDSSTNRSTNNANIYFEAIRIADK